ncbi:MAG TPA: pyruvate kinase [Phnomibacter sp.]|nr:pyruvate kinase [Phnomibacter sp.]
MAAKGIIKQLSAIEKEFAAIRREYEQWLLTGPVRPEHHLSAINLLQYLALRKKNISKLQNALHEQGLSSMASSESHIHRQLQEILMRLGQRFSPSVRNTCSVSKAKALMIRNTGSLFGPNPKDGGIPIMVTLDSETHIDKHAIASLLKRGMQIARINCAHDNAETWGKMVELVRKAEKETGVPCKIYMDLAGPKFRVKVCHHARDQGKVEVSVGERLILTEETEISNIKGKAIYCQIPGISRMLSKGNIMMMDDGLIEAIVTNEVLYGSEITITRISGKPFIKSGKGINFPNTPIPIGSLTKEDKHSLIFIKNHADLVGYSFVRTVDDLQDLHAHLYDGSPEKLPGLIIKIETPEAVDNLPYLLLFAMRYPSFGVMIARGDLAVEIGFERMSEIQEEILWICEAAHTPVIWATQVLEQLNKTGMAARSEITDAYKAAQAECIMINKGKYTHLVLDTLNDIAKRSHRHHLKKRYEMQALGIAKRFSFRKL